jgi:hypothetical protein
MNNATPTAAQIIADFPACAIYAEDSAREFVSGDKIAVLRETPNHGTVVESYTLGSVAESAERYGQDPTEAIQRAVENGHEIFYASRNAKFMTAGPIVKKIVPGFRHGDEIRFSGHTFVIEPASNHNIRLRMV